MAAKPIPEGFHTITPYMTIRGVPAYVEFLRAAFDAIEGHRMLTPKGEVMYTDVQIGNSKLMMGEAMDRPAAQSAFYLYVPDCDAAYRKAVAAGATSVMEPADQFYGDRNAGVVDKWGNTWWLSTHIKDVTPSEAEKMAAERE